MFTGIWVVINYGQIVTLTGSRMTPGSHSERVTPEFINDSLEFAGAPPGRTTCPRRAGNSRDKDSGVLPSAMNRDAG